MATLRSIGSIRKLGTQQPRPPGAPIPSTVHGRPPGNPLRQPLHPRGPETLGLGRERETGNPLWTVPPAFFTSTATVSRLEWLLYVASSRYFNDPKDPRQPPYTGSRSGVWAYQVPELPGAVRQVGGSVSDFVYYLGIGAIIVRLDTFYFHTAADPAQQARDRYVSLHAQSPGIEVRTMYDTQLLSDNTGEAAVKALADVLAGRTLIAPVRSGLAYAPRDEIFQ